MSARKSAWRQGRSRLAGDRPKKERRRLAIIAFVAVGAIAALHLTILALEMFLSETRGLAVFRLTPEFARASKALGANRGLYNSFLAAGLIGGLWLGAGGRAS